MKSSISLLVALVATCHAAALSVPTVSVPTVSQPQCIAGPRVYNARLCNVSCGIDRPGGDYGNAHTGTFEACVQACSADPKCVTAQYHESSGYCYFKNVRNPTVASTTDDTVDCPEPNGSACSVNTDCTSLYCNSKNVCASLFSFP